MTIGVVDYDSGNLKSVETALDHLELEYVTSGDSAQLRDADVLIVPGVGEAASAMDSLRRRGLDTLIRSHAHSGRRLVGICLGLQLFVEYSEERDTTCLSLLPGRVVRFPKSDARKVPHMGWNQVIRSGAHPIFDGIPDNRSFYFVHSYYLDPKTAPDTIATTEYSSKFSSVIERENIVAFQFHPEKSGPYGLRLLQNAIGSAIC